MGGVRGCLTGGDKGADQRTSCTYICTYICTFICTFIQYRDAIVGADPVKSRDYVHRAGRLDREGSDDGHAASRQAEGGEADPAGRIEEDRALGGPRVNGLTIRSSVGISGFA